MKRKEILQQVSESYPKHQDLSGIPTEKLKRYLAKQAQQQGSGEGNQIKRVRAELQRREQQGVSEGIEDTRRQVNLKKKIDKGTATPAQIKEYEALKAKNTGKKQGVSEGFDARQRTRLNDLIDLYRDSIDPNPYTDADDPDDVILRIRQEFGDKIADQVESGARKMHFPRDNHVMGRGDPLSWKQPVDPDRITKKGKMYKQDSNYRKNTIKSRYNLSGRSSTREDTQIESSGRQRYEEMKDKIAGVLIKLYHQGEDSESMQGFKDRVANHLGYDPEDPIYDQAWFTSLTDASAEGSFDDEDEEDYTDYSMRKGEMGEMSEEVGYDQVSAKSASYILRKLDQGASLSDVIDDFPELSRMIDVIAGEHGLHPDDDFEEIEDVLRNDLEDIASQEDDFGDYGLDDEEDEVNEIAPAIAGVGRIVGSVAAQAASGAAQKALEPSDKQKGQGSVEKIAGDQVTIKTPDGSSITTDKSTLQQDDQGHLVLNKAALNAPKSQEKPLAPGTQVQVTSSVAPDGSDIRSILKLAGL
jgi:hypothetical protein